MANITDDGNGQLSNQLIGVFGKGWDDKTLRHCLRCAETFSEAQIVWECLQP